MDKKKLLHVLYAGQGGLGTYFMNFVNADHEAHFEHYAFFYGIEPLNQELAAFCQEKNIPYHYQLKQGKVDWKGIKAVLQFRKKHQITFILLHTFSLSLLTLISLLNSWKVIAIDHTTLSFKTKVEKVYTLINHLFSYKMIYFYKGHFENVKRVFPFLIFSNNSHIIPKTVETNFFKPKLNKQPNEVFRLGITSRLIQGKRHDLILQAIQILNQRGIYVKFKIAGTGPNEASLKSLASRLELDNQVEFVGLLDKHDLLAFYQSLDAYIHATEGETICYSIMEAQACGLPILASDVEGVNNEMNDGETALLFENAVDSVATSIQQLIEDRILFQSLTANATKIITQKSKEANNPEMLNSILEQ